MKKALLLGIVTIGLTMISCNSKKTEAFQVYMEETANVKRLPLNIGVDPYQGNNFFHVDTNDVAYYSWMTPMSNSELYIDIYNLDSSTFSKKIPIDPRTTNIVAPQYHAISKTGEIYVDNIVPQVMYQLNDKGRVVSHYDFREVDGIDYTYIQIPSTMIYYTPLVIDGGKIICSTDPAIYNLGFSTGDPNEVCPDVPIAYMLDTVSKDIQVSSLTFPKLNSEKYDANTYRFSRVFDGSKYVFSFMTTGDLYVTSDLREFSIVKAESHIVGDIYVDTNIDYMALSENEVANMRYTMPKYGSIVYDNYNDVFYRFCYAACEPLKDINYNNYNVYEYSRGDFSIQIFDKNLEKIGETNFKAGKYAPMMFFLNKEGLWISENNYSRPDYTDEELIFRCLELKCNN